MHKYFQIYETNELGYSQSETEIWTNTKWMASRLGKIYLLSFCPTWKWVFCKEHILEKGINFSSIYEIHITQWSLNYVRI